MTKTNDPQSAPKPSKKGSVARIVTGSFLVIMAIHIIVFTAIGIFTPLGWRLLSIFAVGVGIMVLAYLALVPYSRRHPETKWLRKLPLMEKFTSK